MRILFLARYLPNEGSSIQMLSLAQGLVEKGHHVKVLSAGPKNNEESEALFLRSKKKGVLHAHVPFPKDRKFTNVGKFLQFLQYLISVPVFFYQCTRFRPDIIHVHYPVTSYLAYIYKKMTGKKFVSTYHIQGIPHHILHWNSDYVVAISSELRRELIDYHGYEPSSVHLIHNGVSERKFDGQLATTSEKEQFKKKINVTNPTKIVGFIGSLNHRKGLDILFQAMRLTQSSYHLVIVGDGDIDWTISIALEHEIIHRVSFFPYQDPIKFYRIMDLFVLPSRVEGFPLVAVEALMMGVPVVRSKTAGANDQILEGVNGLTFESENFTALAYCIDQILEGDANSYDQVHIRSNAIEKFSEDKMLADMISLYFKSLDV